MQTSIYKLLLDHRLAETTGRNKGALRFSVACKFLLSLCFTIATLLYLPVGMWYRRAPHFRTTQPCTSPSRCFTSRRLLRCSFAGPEHYRKDWVLHTGRAACQHVAVLCIVLFYSTFNLDFGRLESYIVQGVVHQEKKKKAKKR